MFTYEYPRPMFTTDCMVFNYANNEISLLLIERGHEPFKGMWATPGGFMEMDEEPSVCSKRELFEETGIKIENVFFSSLGGAVDRDPRGRLLSAFYFTLLKDSKLKAKANDDAKNVRWFSISDLPDCAADHIVHIICAIQTILDNARSLHYSFQGLFDGFSENDKKLIISICEKALQK